MRTEQIDKYKLRVYFNDMLSWVDQIKADCRFEIYDDYFIYEVEDELMFKGEHPHNFKHIDKVNYIDMVYEPFINFQRLVEEKTIRISKSEIEVENNTKGVVTMIEIGGVLIDITVEGQFDDYTKEAIKEQFINKTN